MIATKQNQNSFLFLNDKELSMAIKTYIEYSQTIDKECTVKHVSW